MRGKHAILSEQKQIRTLEAIVEKLETNLAAERKERKTLQCKLTDQSSMLKEVTRLRIQVNGRVSDKYLKLKKKYDKARNTISKLESSGIQREKGVGMLIGMYAKERKITRTEALDAWVGKVSGKKDSLILFETYKSRPMGRLTGVIENMRRKKFDAQKRWAESKGK
jgi:septal ring factor EnvC (AmiA/AmiB activator)